MCVCVIIIVPLQGYPLRSDPDYSAETAAARQQAPTTTSSCSGNYTTAPHVIELIMMCNECYAMWLEYALFRTHCFHRVFDSFNLFSRKRPLSITYSLVKTWLKAVLSKFVARSYFEAIK